MNLKKGTFVICLLMSGLSSPAELAQLQLQPRHQRTCLGLMIAVFTTTYALKTMYPSTPVTPVCHTITATVTSSHWSNPARAVSITRPVGESAFAHIPSNKRESFTAGVLTKCINTPPDPNQSLHVNNVKFHETPCTDRSISDLTLIQVTDFEFPKPNL